MELELVKFLRSFPDVASALNEVKSKYALHVNAHKKYPNLLQFKYDQLDSPMSKRLVEESRGVILDSANNWNVVAYPFSKFYGYAEGRAAKIDWKSASIWEKVDGSLMFMYWYDGHWEVASSGLPDASGSINGTDYTLNQLFWDTWNAMGYALPVDTNVTHMFELTSPETVVIVPHTKRTITFIGARDIVSGNELSIDCDCFTSAWIRPRRFQVTSEAEAINQCAKMNPMEQEGFVVVDKNFNRVKMKSPQYAAIAHLGFTREEIIEKGLRLDKYDEKLQMKWMLQIIVINECDEFLSYYPQYTNMYRNIRAKYDTLIASMNALYDTVKGITNQFEYAAKVKDHPLSGVFFRLKSGGLSSVEAGVRETDVKKLLNIITKVSK